MQRDPSSEIYSPQLPEAEHYLRFWGTRGSVPVSGTQYGYYGGNTSCLEIRDGEELAIIDAGTGIRSLGQEIVNASIRTIHLIFGHSHWDHIIGFPFFVPLFDKKTTVHIYADNSREHSIQSILQKMLNPDFFPLRFEEIQAKMHFHDLNAQQALQIGRLSISHTQCNHPGSALGFKIRSPHRTVGYVTDNEFLQGYLGHPQAIDQNHPALQSYQSFIEFFHGIELFIHEAQYTCEEYRQRIGWGHTSISNAALLMKLCNIKSWCLTHHDPSADDMVLRQRLEILDQILEDCQSNTQTSFAYEGQHISL